MSDDLLRRVAMDNTLEGATEHARDLVEFAYVNGYHEHGYNVLDTLIAAAERRGYEAGARDEREHAIGVAETAIAWAAEFGWTVEQACRGILDRIRARTTQPPVEVPVPGDEMPSLAGVAPGHVWKRVSGGWTLRKVNA